MQNIYFFSDLWEANPAILYSVHTPVTQVGDGNGDAAGEDGAPTDPRALLAQHHRRCGRPAGALLCQPRQPARPPPLDIQVMLC